MSSTSADAPFAAQLLAEYAHALRFDALPPEVVRRAKDCFVDAVGAAIYGHGVTAGLAAMRFAEHASHGPCAIVGSAQRVDAETAAFVGGVLTHAAELDSLRQPGSGVHPGAALVPAAIAAAQSYRDGVDGVRQNISGKQLLTALVAGIEVMFRIGNATKHSAEARGFHAPGLTGPYGAAIVAGLLAGFDATQLKAALGVAGSLGAGLLEFAKAGDGGIVKRVHLGRAAQAGITAVRLVQAGFAGPSSVLEGRFGFLSAYCVESDPALLTAGIGTHDARYETLTLCLKRYACHITAHTPVYAAQQLRARHAIDPARLARVRIEGAPRLAANHDIKAPRDQVLAQYSVPFCVAAALLHDADDPSTFGPRLIEDVSIRALAQRIEIVASDTKGLATVTQIELDDGTRVEQTQTDFPGCPTDPLSREQLQAKFMRLTTRLGRDAPTLFERLDGIEHETDVHWLDAAPAIGRGDRTGDAA